MAEPDRPDQPGETAAPKAGPLVPIHGAPIAPPGIQAFRRGDFILYTVRGEPAKVLELMGQLDRQGVGEVVALISHHAQQRAVPEAEDPASSAPAEQEQ